MVVECGGMRLMVDAGLSAKQLCLRMQALGVSPETLDGVLLTHEHGDHVRGLRVFLSKFPKVPVFATRDTQRVVRMSGIEGGIWKTFEAGQKFAIGDVEVQSFAIQHDAVDPVGFVVESNAKKLGLLSDAGHVTRSVIERLRELDALFVEANYDESLLEEDVKRPWSIKQRISSRHGHLSNRQVGELLKEVSHQSLKRVVFGHLSSDCNQPELVIRCLGACLHELGHGHVELSCATQDQVTGWFDI